MGMVRPIPFYLVTNTVGIVIPWYVYAASARCHVEAAMALPSFASGTLNGSNLGRGPDLVYPFFWVPTQ